MGFWRARPNQPPLPLRHQYINRLTIIKERAQVVREISVALPHRRSITLIRSFN